MSWILLTGNVTLDTVQVVKAFPKEDSEQRALRQWQATGGNAANTARLLAAHQHRCDFAGVIADDPAGHFIRESLESDGISLVPAVRKPGVSPLSWVMLNSSTGSRTIVHYRDLPELEAASFRRIPLERYDWLHFEGRNVEALSDMLAHARARLVDQPVSLEIEKVRPGLEALIPLTAVTLFSGAYARAHSFTDAATFLQDRQQRHGAHWMTCTWGDAGAWAIDHQGEILYAPAVVPDGPVVDSNGAGDAFNAGLIHALTTGQTLAEALHYAVKLAGRKVQQQGFKGLP